MFLILSTAFTRNAGSGPPLIKGGRGLFLISIGRYTSPLIPLQRGRYIDAIRKPETVTEIVKDYTEAGGMTIN